MRSARHREIAGLLSVLLVIILCVLGPFMTNKPVPFTGDGSPARQLAYVLVLMVVIYASGPLGSYRKIFAIPFFLAITFLWYWISLFWSIAPDIGARRLSLTTIVVLVIFSGVRKSNLDELINWTGAIFLIVLILNFLTVLFLPHIGIHQPGEEVDTSLVGGWRGIMLQKNFAGAICAFTIMLFLFSCRKWDYRLRALILLLSLIFIVKTQSKTSAGLMLISVTIGATFYLYNPKYRQLVAPLFAILSSAVVFLISLESALLDKILYDPEAFTGRTQIWRSLLRYAQDNLMLGSGFGSFWNIGFGVSPIFKYSRGWVLTYAAQGHNGYLDILITTGIIGLILTVISCVIVPLFKLVSATSISREYRALLVSFIIFSAGHNMTESSLMDRDTIVQVFLMLALAITWKILRKADTVPHMAMPLRHAPRIDTDIPPDAAAPR